MTQTVDAALADVRLYMGGNAYMAFVSLLAAMEAQYKDDLVNVAPDRFPAKQAACKQVMALHSTLLDREGVLQPTI